MGRSPAWSGTDGCSWRRSIPTPPPSTFFAATASNPTSRRPTTCPSSRPPWRGTGDGGTTWVSPPSPPAKGTRQSLSRGPTDECRRSLHRARSLRRGLARAAAGRPGAHLPAVPAAERGCDGPLDGLLCRLRPHPGPDDPRRDAGLGLTTRAPRVRRLGDDPAGTLPLPPEVRLRPALGPLRDPDVRPHRYGRRLRR